MASNQSETQPNRNLVAEYEAAQTEARDYLDRQEEIPQELLDKIHGLENQNSGFTGLTVYEAFMGKLRQEANRQDKP